MQQKRAGIAWSATKLLHVLTPIRIVALLVTLVLLPSFRGDVIVTDPTHPRFSGSRSR